MTDKDDAFAEAFGDMTETREQEPPKAQDTPPKEEAPPQVEQTAQIQAEAPPQQPPPATEPEKSRVDPEQFKGYLDEREKRQAAENELRELKRQLAQQQQARPQEPPPDFYENPEGYRQHFEGAIEQRMLASKVQQSRFFASREFGEDLTSKAQEWADTLPPAQRQALLDQPSPFHAAIEAFKEHQALQSLRPYGNDIDKLVAERVAAELAKQQAPSPQAPVQQQQAAGNIPPKVAGAGGHVGDAPRQSEGDFFRSVFTR